MGTKKTICIVIVASVFIAFGCSSRRESQDAYLPDMHSAGAVYSAAGLQGFTVEKEASCTDSKSGISYTGYLAINQDEKPLLVLRGSSYCMGFQMGSLMPEATARMSLEYKKSVAESILKLKYDDAPWLFKFLEGQILLLCKDAVEKGSIPLYLLDEMHGVADGASSAGYDVSFEDVLMLNEGFDAIYSMLFTGSLPCLTLLKEKMAVNTALLKEQGRQELASRIEKAVRVSDSTVFFPNAATDLMGCNEFVVSGNATDGRDVFHGRDFMFSPGLYDSENNRYMYPDSSVIAIYMPEEGLPFAAVTAAGFVGHPTALNSRGLSMGVDVVQAACTRPTPGMGSLLVLRDVVQHCGNIEEALGRMKTQDRGVPWLYVIADDEEDKTYTNGIAVESGMSAPDFSGPDVLPLWEQVLLYPLIMLLDDERPEKGIMCRTQDWIFPGTFRGRDMYIKSEDGKHYYGIIFPDQAEAMPDVVIATNHYVIPRMAFTTFSPWINFYSSPVLPSSTRRYTQLLELVEVDYGTIDLEKAKALIDFLNPNRKDSQGNKRYRYEVHGPIEGHHAIIDNKRLVIEALFGYYSDWSKGEEDRWARIDLGQFLASQAAEAAPQD